MTDKEMVTAILKTYESVLTAISGFGNNPERISKYLSIMRVNRGICYYAHTTFGESVINKEWLRRHKNYAQGWNLYWYRQPWCSYTAQDMVASISWRVQKLQEILNEL